MVQSLYANLPNLPKIHKRLSTNNICKSQLKKKAKVDVDDVPEVAEIAGIKAMPSFQVFSNGEKVDEIVGADPIKVFKLINLLA
jgi:hypothetical protein